jgi:hypothetical protein
MDNVKKYFIYYKIFDRSKCLGIAFIEYLSIGDDLES